MNNWKQKVRVDSGTFQWTPDDIIRFIESEVIEGILNDIRFEIGNGSYSKELRAKWLGEKSNE